MSIDRSTITDPGTLALLEVGDAILAEMRASKRPAASGAPASGRAAGGTGGGNATLPPYGRAKGQPIHGAGLDDLRYYLTGCERTLADSSKARFHDRERVMMAAIEAEIARQSGAPPAAENWGGMPGGDDEPNF